mmetsp:Transcript_13680/g.32456  ORF Transcript_13680/g.32456 Transcript_13680/m.32456 type:complete len:208 (-) Transcript_13680:46-669(-)
MDPIAIWVPAVPAVPVTLALARVLAASHAILPVASELASVASVAFGFLAPHFLDLELRRVQLRRPLPLREARLGVVVVLGAILVGILPPQGRHLHKGRPVPKGSGQGVIVVHARGREIRSTAAKLAPLLTSGALAFILAIILAFASPFWSVHIRFVCLATPLIVLPFCFPFPFGFVLAFPFFFFWPPLAVALPPSSLLLALVTFGAL